MTAYSAPRSVRNTALERILLTAAAGLDRFVAGRMERRNSRSAPIGARVAATEVRADALAMGSLGMLPR